MGNKYKEDWPLLEIKRQFSQDEAIKAMEAEIRRLKFRIGEQESEIEELKYELSERPSKLSEDITEIIPKLTKKAKEWQKDDYVAQLKDLLERTRKNRNIYENRMIEWRNKYFSLLASKS